MRVALHGAFFHYHAWIQYSSVFFFFRLIQKHTLSVTVLHEKSRFSQQKGWWHCLSPWGLNCFTYSFLLLHSRHLDPIGQMIPLYLQQGLLSQSSITEDSTYFWFSKYNAPWNSTSMQNFSPNYPLVHVEEPFYAAHPYQQNI